MLASRTASARTALFQLPSHLRVLAHQQSSSRSFSASTSRKIDATEVLAAPPLAVLNGLHAVGLPWYAAIPTAAVLIRGVFVYYLRDIPTRRRQQIRSNLRPLIAQAVRKDVRDYRTALVEKGERPTSIMARVKQRAFISQWRTPHTIGRDFGAPVLSWSSPLNFVTLVASAEAVRMKCGAQTGLLSFLAAPFNAVGRTIAPDLFPPTVDPVEKMAHEMADKIERVRESRLQQAQGQGVSDEVSSNALCESMSSQPPPPSIINSDTAWFDPTLQTEGIAWFTDLTLADPSGALPVMTALVMIGGILVKPLAQPRRYQKRFMPMVSSMPAFLRYPLLRYSTMQHFGMLFSALFAYVLQHVPAGLVLYFFTSMSLNLVQKKWLELKMPLHLGIAPCVRSTRVRSKKQWSARE